MRARVVLLLLVAFAFAGGTMLYARTWLAAQRPAPTDGVAPVTVVAAPKAHVLVASVPIPAGTFVQEAQLAWQGWPDETVAKEYVTLDEAAGDEDAAQRRAGFTGAVARVGVAAGQPITDALVVHPGDRGFLAAVLEPGFRAISVPVNATTGISGFVFPGDRVDVLVSVRMKGEDDEGDNTTRHVSATVLTNVRVLAVDQATEHEDDGAKVAKTATLEVDPKQAEKVALALDMGNLSLSLHSLAREPAPADDFGTILPVHAPLPATREPERNFTLDLEVFSHRPELNTRRPKAGTAAKTTVTVIRGNTAETSSF